MPGTGVVRWGMVSPHNPFPGMNPFLERSWSDVHTRLIGCICDELVRCGLPYGLRARAEEHLAVDDHEDVRSLRPDLALVESWRQGIPPAWKAVGSEAGPVALAVPTLVLREPETERWVEIRSIHGKLITVIEVLSPANKTGIGRERYLRKRSTYNEAEVNVVEIDLLRGGEVTVGASFREAGLATCYSICVFRTTRTDRYEVYHWGLRDRIPAFALPLRAEDADVPLDLQPLLDRAYEMGCYWQDDPARARLNPPLEEDERDYVKKRLVLAGLAEGAEGG